MDNQTKEQLYRIGAAIPKGLMKSAVKTEKVGKEAQEAVEKYMRSKHCTVEQGKKLEKLAEHGAFNQTRTVVDPKKSKQIEALVENKVKDAMRKGDLPPIKRDGFTDMIDRNHERYSKKGRRSFTGIN